MARHLLLLCTLLLVGSTRGGGFSSPTTTGILIHGCHLEADGWEEIVWGSVAEQRLGRLPHGALLALEEDAAVVICGTGGSERGGVKEGEITRRYLQEHLQDLPLFDRLSAALPTDADGRAAAFARLGAITVSDTASRNTVEELERAAEAFAAARVDRCILVSSPTHAPRCLRDAERAFAARGYSPRVLLASPSQTSYAGCEASDVAIIEPAHRGDRDRSLEDGALAMSRLAARCLTVPAPEKRAFAQDLAALLERYGR